MYKVVKSVFANLNIELTVHQIFGKTAITTFIAKHILNWLDKTIRSKKANVIRMYRYDQALILVGQ